MGNCRTTLIVIIFRGVGRESKAHPAFYIVSSLDAERYHLLPLQGDKYCFERNEA